ncbi:MAG: ThuA domain-containing protein [Bacteroidota bacterium]
MNQITLGIFALAFLLSACTQSEPQAQGPQLPPMPEGPAQWIHYQGANDKANKKHIVFISGDEEYRSEEALPQLAKILSRQHGFDCTVLFAQDPAEPGIVKPKYLNNIPGLEALRSADLMVMFTRFRALPDEQMKEIDDYLKQGKPVIGIRTATHAFASKDTAYQWAHYTFNYAGEKADWDGGFGRLVLGETWRYHHGHHKHQSTRGVIAGGAHDHPITKGLATMDIWGPTDVYGIRLPVQPEVSPIILGQVINRVDTFQAEDPLFGLRPTDKEVAEINPARPDAGNPNDPMMPIAWLKSYQVPGGQGGTAFCSTIGSSTDLLSDGVRKMYVNTAYWLTGLEVPADASVSLEGDYQPTAYSFMSDEYWEELRLEVASFQ